MTKKVIITVKGSQYVENAGDDDIELMTTGEYTYENGSGSFWYQETEVTGMEGTVTKFTFSPEEVVIAREGSFASRMVFVEGKKNIFLYETPYGSATMGIDTHSIRNSLTEKGGVLDIDYTLQVERTVVSRNRFIVKIKEQAV